MTDSSAVARDLERKTQELRVRLEQDLDEIHARRERLSTAARAAARSPALRVLALAAAGVACGVLIVRRRRTRRPPAALSELLKPQPRSSGFPRRALEKAGLTLLLTLARRLGERLFERWLRQSPVLPPSRQASLAG